MPPSGAQMMRQVKFFWGAMAVIIADARLPGLPHHRTRARRAAIAASASGNAGQTSSIAGPAAAEALPPVYISLKSDAEGPVRVASVLRTGLSGFDTVDFIGRDLGRAATGADPLQFVFAGRPGLAEGDVSMELQQARAARCCCPACLPAADIAATGTRRQYRRHI